MLKNINTKYILEHLVKICVRGSFQLRHYTDKREICVINYLRIAMMSYIVLWKDVLDHP